MIGYFLCSLWGTEWWLNHLDRFCTHKKEVFRDFYYSLVISSPIQLKILYQQTEPLLWLPTGMPHDIKNTPCWYEWLFCVNVSFMTRKGRRDRFLSPQKLTRKGKLKGEKTQKCRYLLKRQWKHHRFKAEWTSHISLHAKKILSMTTHHFSWQTT